MRTHVEKRSKNRYTIVIEKGRKPDGSRDRDYIPTDITNKRIAEEEADRILNEYRNGTYIKPAGMTFGDFLDKWLKEYCLPKIAVKKFSEPTYAFYEEMFRIHTKPFLGNTPLDNLGPFDLQRYYNYLRTEGRKDGKPGGLSESTVFKHHCILHKALKTGAKWKFVKENAADAVEKPTRPDSGANSCYEPEQAIKMLEVARSKEDHKWYSILAVAVYSGARRGEILGFRWQDIDWDKNILKVRQTVQYTKEKGVFFKGPKSKKGKRDIQVPQLVIEALRQHRANQENFKNALGNDYNDNDLIFCQDDGKQIFPDTISSWFAYFLSEKKLPKIRFHDLRHTNISIMIANKVPDIEIARRAGHADPATPHRLYGHVYTSMQNEAANAIENALTKHEKPKDPNPEQPTPTSAKVIAFPKRSLA